jgi:hypothetical protein
MAADGSIPGHWPGTVRPSNVADVQGIAAAVVLIAILLGILLVVAFDLFCLVRLAASERVRFLPRLAWAVLIVCASPFGGAAFLLCQRQPQRSRHPPCVSPPSAGTNFGR